MLHWRFNTVFFIISGFITICANAESHTIRFENQCGFGTPRLIKGPNILPLTDGSYTVNGVFSSAIAYLQTGKCLFNGEGCTTVEMTLGNPTCPGCGSSTDISLIPPLKFSVPTGFLYYGGCDGQGATCSSENCDTAFFRPDDNQVQVQCQEDNVNLLIVFCGSGKQTTSVSASTAISASTASPTRVTTSDTKSSSIRPSTSHSSLPATSSAPGGRVNRKSCRNKRADETALISAIRAHRQRRAF